MHFLMRSLSSSTAPALRGGAWITALLLVLLAAGAARAQPQASFVAETHQNVHMEVGETRLIRLSVPVIRVSVANPEVADVQVVTSSQVLITAKAVGFTHLILWSSNELPLVMAISATRNLDQLREQFSKLFPGEKMTVSSVGDLLVLSGTVSDLRLPARAAEVARLHSERVANLIQVTGDQQVQLDVRFAEVSRSGLREMGANFLWQDNARSYIGGQTPPGVQPGSYLRTETAHIPGTNENSPPLVGAPAKTNAFNYFFSTGLGSFPFSAMLSILAQEGLAKVLAEPTLVALSGQDAHFHSGGEVPILLAQTLGNVSVQFKKFGVLLHFTPTVLGERTVSLQLGLEVSEPDPAIGVTLGGFSVPGFRTRSSDTTIRLKDGQSFAIAGLLSDQSRNLISKVPALGDLPIFGALFRSTSYQREETELLMVVTAHLVRPLQPGEVPILPGEDEYNDPNDFELFLLGKLSSDKRESYEHGRPPTEDPTSPASAFAPKPGSSGAQPSEAPAAAPAKAPETPTPPKTQANGSDGPVGPIGFIRS
jgi:pilus assembly protein CpaC